MLRKRIRELEQESGRRVSLADLESDAGRRGTGPGRCSSLLPVADLPFTPRYVTLDADDDGRILELDGNRYRFCAQCLALTRLGSGAPASKGCKH